MIELRKNLVFMGTKIRAYAKDPDDVEPFFVVGEAIGLQNSTHSRRRWTIRKIEVLNAVTEALSRLALADLAAADRRELRDELFRILREDEGLSSYKAQQLAKGEMA